MDASLVGTNTAELMEAIEESYTLDDDARVVEVMTIVTVHTSKAPEDAEGDDAVSEDGYSYVHYRASETYWHRQLGLIEAARHAILGR